jgi:glucose/mannose transport system permease protein
MMGPTLATVFTLLATGVVKVFDTVVAMTQGGPGTASAVVLLLTVLALIAPLAYARSRQKAKGAHA